MEMEADIFGRQGQDDYDLGVGQSGEGKEEKGGREKRVLTAVV